MGFLRASLIFNIRYKVLSLTKKKLPPCGDAICVFFIPTYEDFVEVPRSMVWLQLNANFWGHFVRTRKCPHILNCPHRAGVHSYVCPRKCAFVSAHTHTHTHILTFCGLRGPRWEPTLRGPTEISMLSEQSHV